jgi:hypothetical protein
MIRVPLRPEESVVVEIQRLPPFTGARLVEAWKGGTRFFSSLASNFQRCQPFPALPAFSSVASIFQRCQRATN